MQRFAECPFWKLILKQTGSLYRKTYTERRNNQMDTVLLVFVGAMCVMLGMRVYHSEEQNRIFTKYPIKVTDVKKYNHG